MITYSNCFSGYAVRQQLSDILIITHICRIYFSMGEKQCLDSATNCTTLLEAFANADLPEQASQVGVKEVSSGDALIAYHESGMRPELLTEQCQAASIFFMPRLHLHSDNLAA